jgi:hypothetical protein
MEHGNSRTAYRVPAWNTGTAVLLTMCRNRPQEKLNGLLCARTDHGIAGQLTERGMVRPRGQQDSVLCLINNVLEEKKEKPAMCRNGPWEQQDSVPCEE